MRCRVANSSQDPCPNEATHWAVFPDGDRAPGCVEHCLAIQRQAANMHAFVEIVPTAGGKNERHRT